MDLILSLSLSLSPSLSPSFPLLSLYLHIYLSISISIYLSIYLSISSETLIQLISFKILLLWLLMQQIHRLVHIALITFSWLCSKLLIANISNFIYDITIPFLLTFKQKGDHHLTTYRWWSFVYRWSLKMIITFMGNYFLSLCSEITIYFWYTSNRF